jgi:putative redox protein
MKSTVVWKNELNFECTNERGDTVLLDGNKGTTSPMEVVLSAAGACSSVDVVEILKKGRFDLQGCVCEIEGIRAEGPPAVFTHINAHYIVTGKDLSEKAVARAVELSVEKYCSVMKMLEAKVEITTSYEISHAV